MRPTKLQALNQVLEDGLQVNHRFFNPLAPEQDKIFPGIFRTIEPRPVFCKLLTFHDEENKMMSDFVEDTPETLQNRINQVDSNLPKILLNSMASNPPNEQEVQKMDSRAYSFNFDLKVSFNQTPGFKCVLQTPIQVFCKNYNSEIQQLFNLNYSTQRFRQIRKKQNPCLYFNQAGSYFVGIGLTFQSFNSVYESLFFLKLACYAQPFNMRVWDEIISFSKKVGHWKKACQFSKTAFLFTLNSSYAEQYLQCGDKARVMMCELRGLLTSLRNPQRYEKAIVESAKYEIKNRKMWRGVILANKFCSQSNYKPNLCYAIILVAKCLENIGMGKIALQILKTSLSRGISKYQAFSTYIQIKLRQNNGQMTPNQVKFLQDCMENLTVETRYRLSLSIAQFLTNKKDRKNYRHYIDKAVLLANKHCKGVGKGRALREIYFSVITSFNLQIEKKLMQFHKNDEHLIFLSNRKRFIDGQNLIMYRFKNWKYYLHYALEKNAHVLIEAFAEHNQGRIIAQAIHVLRLSKKPLTMLQFWRQKIEEIPKSGELWCEGGRIFVDLGQTENAIKCFQNAIHFTPQFGDSFIELLKLLLASSDFAQINQLRKNFQISEPYYGNVLSYLLSNRATCSHFKLSLRQVWNLATEEANYALYSKRWVGVPQLTACASYNQAFECPYDRTIRQTLFSSYEQMENKITKI